MTSALSQSAEADDAAEAITAAFRVLPAGQTPADARLQPLTALRENYFPFDPPETERQWQGRAEALRRQIRVAAGLWPEAELPAPRAVVHGPVQRGDYTVEKVYLESYPGHFVTGNLYRPRRSAESPARMSAVLSPYGHWRGGRFEEVGSEEVERQLAEGAETSPAAARHPLQARCAQLARMGCMVFLFDLVGYADSQQIPAAVAHDIRATRPELDGPERWGFFSTQAELRMQSLFGLQVYNARCALDWLASLPEVDPARIGVTGGSGGATQTMMLCGLDSRPAAAFEAVMVSTAMQGGCPCENACCLRIAAGNVEIAALMAPRPLGLASANDWTAQFHELGYPELQQLYALLGVTQRVRLAKLTQFRHNYNAATRAAMYEWFNEHLALGQSAPIVERDFRPLSREEASVWDASHPPPPAGVQHEVALLRAITQRDERQLAAIRPRDSKTLERFRNTLDAAYAAIVGPLPQPDDCSLKVVRSTTVDDVIIQSCLVRDGARHAELPMVLLRPPGWNGEVVLWAQGEGKSGLLDASGRFAKTVEKLLAAATAVAGVDLLGQGEFTAAGRSATSNRLAGGDRDLAAFTYGYNRALLAQRAADVVAAGRALRKTTMPPRRVVLLATHRSAPYATAAYALSHGAFDAAAIDTRGFRFENLTSWKDARFLPGAVKYGDLPGMLALAAPQHLAVAGETAESLQLAIDGYGAADAAQELAIIASDADSAESRLGDWLTQQKP